MESSRVYVKQTLATMSRIDRATARASMWTVREAGRKVKQEARRSAPVYKGDDAQHRLKKGAAGPMGSPNRPVSGLLRASIHSRRQLKRLGPGVYENAVAPRGLRVHLYTQRIEAQYHYMRDAYSKVAPLVPGIAARAWAKAMRKG